MAKRQILEGVGKNQTSFGRPKSSINGTKQKQDLIQTHRQYQSALFEINLAITSSLDLAAILDILMDKIGSLPANFASEVWLLDRESRQLKRMTSRNLDEEEWVERELGTTPLLLKAALEKKAPVFVSNIQTDPWVLDSNCFRKHGLVSFLGVPLIVKREVLGVVTFMTREEHQFSKEETEFLSTLAGQAAIAIHNSQLHAQITEQAVELKRANEDLKRREAIQQLLKELSQDITFLDIDKMLGKLTGKVREVFKVDVSDVRLKEQNAWKVMGASGLEPERIRSGAVRSGKGRSSWVINNRRPLSITDINAATPTIGETTRQLGIRGYLGVPLFSKRGEVIGILRALTYQPRKFSVEEIDLLQHLANEVAIALENSRLLSNLNSVNQELERTSQEQTVLKGFLENLLFLDLDRLLQRLTEQAVTLFNAEFAWARLLDEKGRIKTGAVAGEEAVVKLMTTTEEKKLVGRGRWMLDNGKPLAVEDMAQDPARPYRAWVKAADLHGFLGAPLFSRDQKPLGVIHVMTRSPRQFSPREIDLVEQFANVAAIAIENGTLLQQLRESTQDLQSANVFLNSLLNEQSSLREIITNINVMDRSELLKKVTEHALRLLKVDHALVRLLDADGILQTVAYTGEGVEHYQKRLSESGRNRSGWVMENCRPLAIKDLGQDEVFGQGHLLREMGVKGFLMVPLVSRGQKSIGVLGLTSIKEREFTKDEIALTQQFAAGAAIAIENANLYQESRRREEIQTLLKELSQDVTLLDIESLLKKLTERVREILKVDVSDVRLMENGTSEFIGISGVEPERLQSERTGTVRGRFKWILENRKPLMIPDTTKRNDIPTGESVRRLGIRGYLGVPLFSKRGEVIGVLRALTYEPRRFSQEEIDLLQHLTNEATIALENAKLLEEIRKQTEELKQSNRLKSEFLSIMSHELRTPLNAIVGYTEMIRDRMLGDINPRQGKVLEKVVLRSKDLLSMITSILQATSIEGGAIKVDRKGFDLNHFLDELKSIYDVPLGKELTLVWDYPRGLPFVTTDSEKLKCILQNLINNAIKFTDRGQVTVSARYLSESGKVGFEVADTGIGISQEALPAIFEMFRQVDGSETRAHGGVGLGLYIVKRLAKLLGGKVEVESEFGKGSAFTVTISSQN